MKTLNLTTRLSTVAVAGLLLASMTLAGLAQSAMPSAETLEKVAKEAYAKFKDDTSGKNADYIPYLASVPSNLFGVVIVTAAGQVFTAGDVDYSFSIQSCSKVFTMCQVMQESGEEAVFKKIGVEPTGMPFNSDGAWDAH